MTSQFGSARQVEIYSRGGPGAVPVSARRLERLARRAMTPAARDYVFGAAGGEATLRANRGAFDHWRIVPRMLRDVSQRDLRVELFGATLPAPVLLAPVGVAQGEKHHQRARAVFFPSLVKTQFKPGERRPVGDGEVKRDQRAAAGEAQKMQAPLFGQERDEGAVEAGALGRTQYGCALATLPARGFDFQAIVERRLGFGRPREDVAMERAESPQGTFAARQPGHGGAIAEGGDFGPIARQRQIALAQHGAHVHAQTGIVEAARKRVSLRIRQGIEAQ